MGYVPSVPRFPNDDDSCLAITPVTLLDGLKPATLTALSWRDVMPQSEAPGSSKATATPRQQIDHQLGQIKQLQEQIRTDSATSIQAQSTARTQGFGQGAGIGLGASLLLFAVIFSVKKVTRSNPKPQARAASAS